MNTKTLKTLALAAFLSLGLISATASPLNNDHPAMIGQKIKQAVSLPQELKTAGFSQKVKVSFVLNAQGCVESVAANTSNRVLKQKLEDQFMQLALPELKAGTYNVELNFNVY